MAHGLASLVWPRRREERIRRRRSRLAQILLGAVALTAVLTAPPARADAYTPPPIRHVWVIVLENSSFNKVAPFCCSPFNTPGYSPYLANVLTKQGNLLTQYWGTGHNSLDNYIAMVSGQSPTPGTQSDAIFCAGGVAAPNRVSDDIPNESPVDPNGQIVGQGCTYPSKVKTLGDQLDANGLTWKGYMQDLRDEISREGADCPTEERNNPGGGDTYLKKHDPFQWFHSIIDDQSRCLSHDVGMWDLARDLQSVETTPNFSFISPGTFDDGHDGDWTTTTDRFLNQFVPMIMSSPAYRQDGMILVTFDESSTLVGAPLGPEDDGACCNEIPGPNSPDPGIVGPGGGRTGALVLSPFVKPGSIDDPPDNPFHTGTGFYNHYSFLRSMEDVFGIDTGGDDGDGHLGFAGTYADYPGPGSFGPDVYTGYDGSPARPPSPEPAHGPTGPRPADGTAIWQNPVPQGGDVEGISCANESACVAVGDAGTILATGDGGDSWSPQSSDTATHLRAVSCASASDCVAVGDVGTALASADGGATWSAHPSGTSEALNGVNCASASVCVAVGDAGTILRSDDGGTSWAPQASGTSEPLYGVSCPTESACYAVGRTATVATTTNGSTWSVKSLSSGFAQRLWSVSCANATTCVAAGDGGSLQLTTNGGATWSSQSAFSLAQVRGASCPSPSTCFVAGEGGLPNAGGIVGTTNANESNPNSVRWTQQTTHSGNPLRAISCPSTSMCIAAGMRGGILRTTNGGADWSVRSPGSEGDLSRICPSVHCTAEAMNALQGTSCTDASTCYAVGSYRTVMATGDGGATWTMQTSGVPSSTGDRPLPPPGLNGIDCPASGKCFAVGDLGSIVATSDGGANWSNQDSGADGDLLGVACPSEAVCYAVGSRGTILKTRDAGGRWVKLNSGGDDLLSDVSCPDLHDCVAVGSLGAALTTDDGGAIWSAADSGTAAYLDGVACPTLTTCLAVGQGGTALRSTDAGQHWSPHDSGVGDDLMSVSCSSAARCLASGSAGTAISSADGGISWTVHGTGTARALRAAAMPSANRGLVVGDAGAILSVSSNQPPSAAFAFQPAAPQTGEAVSFDASASSDPDGQIARYEWDLDGDGSFETDSGSSPTATHSYAKSGTYAVSLRVTDDDGASGVVSHQVTVANRAPTAAFVFSPALPRKKKPVTFDASASSDPDGSIAKYEWDLDGNGSFETDSGANPKATHTYAKKGTYTVSLRVTDDEGATARISHNVVVK